MRSILTLPSISEQAKEIRRSMLSSRKEFDDVNILEKGQLSEQTSQIEDKLKNSDFIIKNR